MATKVKTGRKDHDGKKLKRLLLVPDVHCPYEDKAAVRLMLSAAANLRPDTVCILGDFADFYSVSSHSKNPKRVASFQEEVDAVNALLDSFEALGANRKIYIAGNHENRLERFLTDRAPALFDYTGLQIPDIFGLTSRGFEYIPYKDYVTIGRLHATHDVGTAGKYAHYKALATFNRNVVIGHTHRLAFAVEGNADGHSHFCAHLGWLGKAEAADYMHKIKAKTEWHLGFGWGLEDEDTGFVYLQPVPIVYDGRKYSCVVEGKYFEEYPDGNV